MKTTEESFVLTDKATEQVNGAGENWRETIFPAIQDRNAGLAKRLFRIYRDMGWLTDAEIIEIKRLFFAAFGYEIDSCRSDMYGKRFYKKSQFFAEHIITRETMLC